MEVNIILPRRTLIHMPPISSTISCQLFTHVPRQVSHRVPKLNSTPQKTPGWYFNGKFRAHLPTTTWTKPQKSQQGILQHSTRPTSKKDSPPNPRSRVDSLVWSMVKLHLILTDGIHICICTLLPGRENQAVRVSFFPNCKRPPFPHPRLFSAILLYYLQGQGIFLPPPPKPTGLPRGWGQASDFGPCRMVQGKCRSQKKKKNPWLFIGSPSPLS